MSIIKLGVIVVGISGTLGGITFSRNKSGPYAKSWARSANPQSAFQQDQRSTVSEMPALWRALTPVQQAAWDTWAALPAQDRTNSLGETFSASGFNWFCIINVRLTNIGRATRTAVPTQSRPAAPTISTMQLPFLPQQGAWVTYPSAEFDPDFDQVIQIAVVPSTGQQVQPATFKQLLLAQDPGDVDNTFLIPYLTRFFLSGSSYKGFAQMFRQTTDGLRSAAGTLSFVSGDTPAFAPTADDYDGTTNYALRGADLTGNTDTKILLASGWFRVNGGDGTIRNILRNSGSRYRINLDTADKLVISLISAAPVTLLVANSSSTFPTSATWHMFIWSIDLATLTVQLVIDGAVETPTIITGPVDGTVDWTNADHAVGAQTSGAGKFDGCLTQLYFNNTARLDISQAENIRLFVDQDGAPVFLGAAGEFPTQTQPIIFITDGDPSTNAGSGGNYVNQAALSACSDSP